MNENLEIFYGTYNNNITEICKDKLLNKDTNIVTIPKGDSSRSNYFTDPLPGTLKKIFIKNTENNENKITEYEDKFIIQINMNTNEIMTIPNTNKDSMDTRVIHQLAHIHSQLKINYGSFNDEFPEQKMAVRYLTGNEKVLEIGGNIGRNSLIIAYILSQHNNNNNNNNPNFVCLECDTAIASQLRENRDLNNFNFQIENTALSKRKLIQRGWDTIESDTLLEGYKPVQTITIEQLKTKYNIEFDTLILDCEGAFYYILMDMPEILNNINTIIMENDYWDISKKNFVDEVLKNNKDNKFYLVYVEKGGWGPCYNNFFEVWKRVTN